MAKKAEPLGSFGHYDYDPSYDPNDTYNHYRGRETAGGLEDRNERPKATQTCRDYPSALHHNRSLIEPEGSTRELRKPTVAEGVSFSERMRADMDDDISHW